MSNNVGEENSMATSLDYIEYAAAQTAGCGSVRYRKMFGEYMIYVNDKPILLVCGNCVFVKILPCLDELMRSAERGFPYDGAKEHYILDIDNAELTQTVVSALEAATPLPKPRKKKAWLNRG
jgi:TfoX/Sxy family transcriptional regulator of competence genes